MLNLKSPIGTNYRVDPNDLMHTKRALSDLGYYDVPPHRGIDDWTDDATFDGIRRFQKDNGLKVDGFMRPGGPTEQAMNTSLADNENKPGLGEGETPPYTGGKGQMREPGNNMPVIVPPFADPNMPVIKKLEKLPGPYIDENGNLILNDPGPLAPRRVRPPKGPY
jgi:hypothetical protein